MDLSFEGLQLDRALWMDVVVEDRIVLELKAAETRLAVWDAQLLSYLWHSRKPLGYIINFRVSRLKHGIQPLINRRIIPLRDASSSSPSSSPSS